MLTRQGRGLEETQKTLLKEFQNMKSKSKCIIEIKEIKQHIGHKIWYFDQWFKVLLDWLSFLILDAWSWSD